MNFNLKQFILTSAMQWSCFLDVLAFTFPLDRGRRRRCLLMSECSLRIPFKRNDNFQFSATTYDPSLTLSPCWALLLLLAPLQSHPVARPRLARTRFLGCGCTTPTLALGPDTRPAGRRIRRYFL